MSARTGLREPWVSNHPGPPDPSIRSFLFNSRECPRTGRTDALDKVGTWRQGDLVSWGDFSFAFAAFPGKCIFFVRSMSNCAQLLCLAGQEDKP